MIKTDLIHAVVRGDGGLDHGHHVRNSLDFEEKVPNCVKESKENGRKTRPTTSRRRVNMALEEEKKGPLSSKA